MFVSFTFIFENDNENIFRKSKVSFQTNIQISKEVLSSLTFHYQDFLLIFF